MMSSYAGNHAPSCASLFLLPDHQLVSRRYPIRIVAIKLCLRSVILCVPLCLLVLSLTALAPPRADRGDICL